MWLPVGVAETRSDVGDRRSLGLADARSALAVRVSHLVREREDEAPVAVDLTRCRLTLEQLDCVPQMLQTVLLEFLNRVVARVVELGLRRDNLVEQLALPVLLARLDVRLCNRDRLPDGASALCGDHDHAGARRSLEHEAPLLLCEVSLSRHRLLLCTVDELDSPSWRVTTSAPERSRIQRNVDGMFLERSERNDLKRTLVGGRQDYVGGGAVLVRAEPIHCGHAPAVAGREPREVVLGHRGDQVVADTTLVLEERGRDHSADRVAPQILWTGTTAPVAEEAREGIHATRLELATEHITIGHSTSIARQTSCSS